MLPSRGIARSVAAAGARRHVASQFTVTPQRLARPGDGRAFGTVLTRTTAPRLTARHAALGPLALGAASTSRLYSLWPFGSSKASPSMPPSPAADPAAMPTTEPIAAAPSPAIPSTPSPAEAAVSPTSVPIVDTAPASVSHDSLDLSTFGLDANSILALPERIGYLRELGLDFGWGPSSMMQWLLEHIHVWGGLDWWACIVLATVAVRAALWVPTMKSLDQTARMGLWRRTPEAKEVASAMTALAAARAPAADVMALRQHQAKLMRDAGIKPLHAFLGMLHIPFGFGIWRVVSNMATIPVPSMETGGLLWFTDLSVPDPFYILPIVAPITMLAMMRTQQRYAEPSQRAFLKIITWVLGPISVIFTSFMPAGVTFYFAFASLLATCQNLITMQPGFRRWAGLTILPPPPEDPTPASQTGATGFAAMRERFRSVVKEAQSKQGGMYDRMNAKSEADRREKAQRLRQEEAWKEIRRRMDKKR